MRGGTVLPAVLTLALSVVSTAHAARTDIIVLKNGDRFTGEVVQMRESKLTVKTDDAGTISIEWDKTAAVTTAERYDVTLYDGTPLLGRLRPGVSGSLEVTNEDGVSVVRMADIASFVAIKSGFFHRIDGSFDLGGSYTQSSGVGQLSLDADANYRRPSYRYAASFSMNFTRQPEAPETSRYAVDLAYTRFRANRWFITAFGLFESNEELGFTLRGTGALSLGRYLARTSHVELLVSGGLAPGRELPVDDDAVTNVDAIGSIDLSWFVYDYPTTRLDFTMLVFPSLDDPGRVRLNTSGKFKRELFRDFYVAASVYDAFDSRPKGEDARQNDVGASVSFGWSF